MFKSDIRKRARDGVGQQGKFSQMELAFSTVPAVQSMRLSVPVGSPTPGERHCFQT